MTEPTSELRALLLRALENALDDSPASVMTRMQIRSGIVGSNPDLIDLFERIAGPDQAEVDFHLDGPGVQGNSTNAHYFSQFVSGISEAVKEAAKSLAGKGRYSENLLIEGVTPGSVRVVLRAPEPVAPHPQQHATEPLTSPSTVDSEALRSIAAILTHASSEDDESPLIAELSRLPVRARGGLRRAARSTSEAGWDIKGSLRQRNYGATEVALTHGGAFRLQQGLDAKVESRADEAVIGYIDGYRRSLSTLYFQPESGAKIIQAAVIDPETAASISELFADPDSLVEVVFDVISTYMPGDETRPQRSRSVKSIRRLARGRQLSIDDTN
ncbi:hypothetical protein PJJ83_07865 [Mycobacterium kansasii]